MRKADIGLLALAVAFIWAAVLVKAPLVGAKADRCYGLAGSSNIPSKLLWNYHDDFLLYKVQDGNCVLYVFLAKSGAAVATGPGCR